MPIIEKLLSLRARGEESWLHGNVLGMGLQTASGRDVTPGQSLQLIAVYACVRVIAETLAALPWPVYKRGPGRSRDQDESHPLYWLLKGFPNPEMTAMNFREALAGHTVLRGKAFASIEWDGFGRPIALWPLRPDRMDVFRDPDTAQLRYIYRVGNGEARRLKPEDVWHIRGMGDDGINGWSPIALAREAIGLGLAMEEYGARFFGNGASPGGILTVKSALSAEAAKRLKEEWQSLHEGLTQSHRVAVLEEGTAWQDVGANPADANWIEGRKYQVEEICRLFRVPPHLVQDLARSTFTNIEHQGIDFRQHTILPWAVRFDQSANQSLLLPSERRTWYTEHNLDGLLRGDAVARATALKIQRDEGIINGDEWRALEGMNPLPDGQGQIYIVPMNMVDLSQMGAESAPAPSPRSRDGDVETRAATPGSAASRLKLQRSHKRLFVDAASRILKREVNDVRAAMARTLQRRDAAEFETWVDDYYTRQLPAAAQRTILPTMLMYATSIYEDALAEIGQDASELPPELENFVRGYAKSFGEAYAGRSAGQIRQLLRKALEEEMDALDLLDERFDEWGNTRPDKVAAIEGTRLNGAMVLMGWKAFGVRKIQWVAQGGKTCPYCRSLDGRIVGIESNFLSEGEDFEPEDALDALNPSSDIRHPPSHATCVCGLAPA